MNKNFKSYFAGLLEGDGSFIVPKTRRDSKGRLRYAKIKIAFAIKDKPLADVLLSHFGGNYETHKNYFVWVISTKKDLLSICNEINGYLRTPKINDFYNLIDFLNEDKNILLRKMPLDKTSIGSNAWLAGFSDADANFNISITRRKKDKKRVQIQFRIEVKEFYNKLPTKNSQEFSTFYPICHKIATNFNLGFYSRTRKNKYHLLIITTTSTFTNAKVIRYFDTFSLFSSKYLDYINWKIVHKLQVKKLHITPSGLKICENIKQNHNKTRHKFSWDHLDNFYLKVNKK